MFFTKGGLCSFATRALLFTIGKNYNWKKVKTKKRDYVQIQKVKTKKLQMKVFEFHT